MGYPRNWPFGRKTIGLDAGSARRQLTFRCEEVERQLVRFGLAVRRLASDQLAQLLYDCWCPELARVQRVRRDLAEYAALVVSSPRTESSGATPSRTQHLGLSTQPLPRRP